MSLKWSQFVMRDENDMMKEIYLEINKTLNSLKKIKNMLIFVLILAIIWFCCKNEIIQKLILH